MRQTPEHGIQVAYFDYVRLKRNVDFDWRLVFAIPNGAKLPYAKKLDRKTGKMTRYSREAQWLIAEGLTPGVADVMIAIPNWKAMIPYACIEFKAGSNKQTEEQLGFETDVSAVGAVYWVCRSPEDAIEKTERYIKEARGD